MARNKLYLLIILIAALTSQMLGCASTDIVGGPIPGRTLKNGTYEGSAVWGPVKVVAKVTLQNQRITEIELVEHRNWKGKAAEEVIPGRIIAEQSTDVDVVSGATISSRVIMNAVEDAIQKAI